MYLLAICKSFLDKKIYSDSLPIFNWAVWVSLILPYMSFSFILKKESIWEMRSESGIWKDVYNLLENKSGFTELKIHNVSKGFPGGFANFFIPTIGARWSPYLHILVNTGYLDFKNIYLFGYTGS